MGAKFLYNVYEVNSGSCYNGYSLVGASNAEQANECIKQFKERDTKNIHDSFGYEFVSEEDKVEDLHSCKTGIIKYGIYYAG